MRPTNQSYRNLILLSLIFFMAVLISWSANKFIAITKAEAADILGADAVVNSYKPYSPEEITLFKEKFTVSLRMRFISMLSAAHAMHLADVHAVDDNFPLKGQVLVRTHGMPVSNTGAPKSGEIWLEGNLRAMLQIQLGDKIKLGDHDFIVSKILVSAPEKYGMLNSLYASYRAIVNYQDIEGSKLVGARVRVLHQLALKGNLKPFAYNNLHKTKLGQIAKNYQIAVPSSYLGSLHSVSLFIKYYVQYYLLINLGLLLILLYLTTIRMRHSEIDTIGLLRCWGLNKWQVLLFYGKKIYLWQLLTILLMLGLLQLIFNKVNIYVGQFASTPASYPYSLLALLCSLFLAIVVFSQVLLLARKRPSAILRPSYNKKSVLFNLYKYLSYGCAMVASAILIAQLMVHSNLENIFAPTKNNNAIKLANILPDYLSVVLAKLQAKNIKYTNVVAVSNFLVLPEQGDDEQAEVYNISKALKINKEENIFAGRDFTRADYGRKVVSLESGVANRLKVTVGDKIKVLLPQGPEVLEVVNIRRANFLTRYESFALVVPPGTFDDEVFSYALDLAQFDLEFLQSLVAEFAPLNFKDARGIWQDKYEFINKVLALLEIIGIFGVIIAGLILFCTIELDFAYSEQEVILYRILGANKKQLFRRFLAKYLVIGAIVGLGAVLMGNYCYQVFVRLFEIKVPNYANSILLYAALIAMAPPIIAYSLMHKIFNKSLTKLYKSWASL